jgi:predicted NAD-dependent protein-ADP-ribosyltransferase YbiA (DUF1768 family)
LELIEDSPVDSFWGRGPDHKGKNHLGKLWMKIQKENESRLRKEFPEDFGKYLREG